MSRVSRIFLVLRWFNGVLTADFFRVSINFALHCIQGILIRAVKVPVLSFNCGEISVRIIRRIQRPMQQEVGSSVKRYLKHQNSTSVMIGKLRFVEQSRVKTRLLTADYDSLTIEAPFAFCLYLNNKEYEREMFSVSRFFSIQTLLKIIIEHSGNVAISNFLK